MRDIEFNVSLIIVIVTVIVSMIGFRNEQFERRWIFNPYMIRNRRQYWRFVTSSFLHADYIHLAFNMFVLYMFGQSIEASFDVDYYGERVKKVFIFLGLYIPATAISSFYSYEKHKKDIYYNAYGASGAVAAVVFAYIGINPVEPLRVMGIIKIPAFMYGGLYLVISWILARRAKDNIGHDAHFFGSLYGIMYIFIIQPHKLPLFFGSVKYYFENLF